MSTKPNDWYAVSVTITPEYTEAAEFAFNGMDSLGSEVDLLSDKNSDLCVVTAYFSSPPDERSVANEMRSAARVYGLPEDVDFVVKSSVVADQDWLAEWKKYWKPVTIGRFVIAAPWHEVDAAGKTVVRIEPNMAFGTGTHETTQLCLAEIDRSFRPGQSFLDVGTGTGILAIAAAMISDGGTSIVAVDTDADAVEIARVNAELNGVADRIRFSAGPIETAPGRFDIVCANLTADVIVPILPDLVDRTGSTLVLSGILAEQEKLVLNAMPQGLSPAIARAGEWIAITAAIKAGDQIPGPGGSIT